MRIALAQINPIMGDFAYNRDKILEFTARAKDKRADVVIFCELALFGYNAFDLLERKEVVSSQLKELKSLIKKIPKGITVIFGAVTENTSSEGKPYNNSAIVAQKGKILAKVSKHLLPSYDVFDDTRFFESSQDNPIVKIPGVGKIAVTVCEDIWTTPKSIKSPLKEFKSCDLIVNISASPFSVGHMESRIKFARGHAKAHNSYFAYVNQVGGQDELVFDGRSFLLNPKGAVVVQAPLGTEDLIISDLKSQRSEYRPVVDEVGEQIRQTIVLGLRDFVRKTGHSRVHLGVSGGIDSAVVATLAVDAIGPGNVTGLILPGPFSSSHSRDDAYALAAKLKIQTYEVNISDAYELLHKSMKNFPRENDGIVSQNIQARLRGLILMGYSNASNSLLLNTSNKSELASGYSTLYGDLCGSISVIGDLTKNQVYELAKIYNQHQEIIPKRSLTKAPSAELAPDQKDQDTLPPYKDLDESVRNLVELRLAPKSKTDHWLKSALFRSEFKRWQAPPIIRVSRHAFGRGRRIPIAHRSK